MAAVQEGLKDVAVAETKVCFIDGEIGKLLYRGYNIQDLATQASFEEVAYLLWQGVFPTRAQLSDLNEQFVAERAIDARVLDTIRALPRSADPMDALRTAVSFQSAFDPELGDNSHDANMRKAVRLTAKFPTMIAAFHRHHLGLDPIAPLSEDSLAGNFLYMVSGKRPDPYVARTLDTSLVLHADHGFNASTFTARVTCATLSDMYAGVVAGIGALKGPLHGGANFAVLEMLKDIGSAARAKDYINEVLAGRRNAPTLPPKRVAGFGHRVYKAHDPRANVLKGMSRTLGERAGDLRWIEISEAVEQAMDNAGMSDKGVYANVDFYSASSYYTMGLDISLFTPIFAMARITGWTAHIMEQHDNNKLIRPIEIYVGEMDLPYVPIDKR
ncbi:citrate synthase [Candidatus Poribacteria bacterium]|nr:citrate synthase [Candidatus Poribacteria bacterium]